MTELIAVRLMFSATSPRNRWLYRLAVVPPGEAASSIIPTASTGGRLNSITSPKHTSGSRINWHANATATALGRRPIRTKSPGVRLSPSPNMMIPSAIGRPMTVMAEPMILIPRDAVPRLFKDQRVTSREDRQATVRRT